MADNTDHPNKQRKRTNTSTPSAAKPPRALVAISLPFGTNRPLFLSVDKAFIDAVLNGASHARGVASGWLLALACQVYNRSPFVHDVGSEDELARTIKHWCFHALLCAGSAPHMAVNCKYNSPSNDTAMALMKQLSLIHI